MIPLRARTCHLQQSFRTCLRSACQHLPPRGTRASGEGRLSLCLLISTASKMNILNGKPFGAYSKGTEEYVYQRLRVHAFLSVEKFPPKCFQIQKTHTRHNEQQWQRPEEGRKRTPTPRTDSGLLYCSWFHNISHPTLFR